jgi:hypothetical protein
MMTAIHQEQNQALGGIWKYGVVLIEAYVQFENFIFQSTSFHRPFHFFQLWNGHKPRTRMGKCKERSDI